jgi:hypothetical protein
MSVQFYEVLDEDRVIVKFQGSNKLRLFKIFHTGRDGILCNDLETFIDFEKTTETVFEE